MDTLLPGRFLAFERIPFFDTNEEGFLVRIGRPKRPKINMMSSEKAKIYLFLPVSQTTQNRRLLLEKKYLFEFSRVQ